MKEASPCQSAARLCSAGDNVLHLPTVQSSVIRSEMKLILQYIDKGNFTAFQALLRGTEISLTSNWNDLFEVYRYPQFTNHCSAPSDKCDILLILLDHPEGYTSLLDNGYMIIC